MFEEVYLEERTKKILKIGGILIFSLILIFILAKVFILKPPLPPSLPPSKIFSPEEVVIKYFLLEQEQNREEAEKYLFSDFSKVNILEEKYEGLRRSFWIRPEMKEGNLPEYQIKNIQTRNNEAQITLDIKTNKMAGSMFYNFYLPEEVIFEINLIKEGDYWKIIKINWPNLITEMKFGEKAELKKNVFIRVTKIRDYLSKARKAGKGFKFLSLEAEYENRSTETVEFSPFVNWSIVDEKNNSYGPIYETALRFKEPIFPEVKLKPNEIKENRIFFEIPENALVKKVIFQNLDKKVIFGID